jgi:hypothetical protein
MYLLILAEYSARRALGSLKPLEIVHPPLGAIGNYILVALAVTELILSLKRPKRSIAIETKSINRVAPLI